MALEVSGNLKNHTQFTRDLTFNHNLGCLSDVCPAVYDLPSYLSTFGRTLGVLHTVLGKYTVNSCTMPETIC
jgi:hypothetical protein